MFAERRWCAEDDEGGRQGAVGDTHWRRFAGSPHPPVYARVVDAVSASSTPSLQQQPLAPLAATHDQQRSLPPRLRPCHPTVVVPPRRRGREPFLAAPRVVVVRAFPSTMDPANPTCVKVAGVSVEFGGSVGFLFGRCHCRCRLHRCHVRSVCIRVASPRYEPPRVFVGDGTLVATFGAIGKTIGEGRTSRCRFH